MRPRHALKLLLVVNAFLGAEQKTAAQHSSAPRFYVIEEEVVAPSLAAIYEQGVSYRRRHEKTPGLERSEIGRQANIISIRQEDRDE